MRTPRPDGGCHQCWTSPSTNCRAAALSRCSRVSSRLAVTRRDHVLQLVAETVGATSLVQRRPRPEPAGERLVDQPAVEHDVHRAVGRPHLDGALRVVPEPRHRRQRHPVVGVAPASDEIDGGGGPVGLAEEYDDLSARSIGQLDGRLEGCTRIQPGAGGSLEAGTAGERSGALWTTVASEELRPIGRPTGLPTAEIEEGDPAGEVGVPRVPGQQRLRFRLVLGDDVRCVGATRRAEHPLGVRSDGQAPRSAGSVLDREHRDLQRLVEWDELHEVEVDAVSHVLEAAVSGTVVGDVGRPLTPDRLRGRAPEVAGVVVADVEGFACWVADGVVGPRRQLVFPAVLGPGVPTAGLGHLEPERLVGDHVEPGSWGRLTGAEDGHVLTPIITEAAEPVEELQLRRRCDGAVPRGLAGDRGRLSDRAAGRLGRSRRVT